MGPSVLSLCLLSVPQVTFADGAFVIQDGTDKATVPLSSAEPPQGIKGDKLSMRIGETLITFDHRGLGIQYKGKGGFTTLAYLPTSPKLFSPEEIKANVAQAEADGRTLAVSALSGFEVVKDRLYLLVRWDDKGGKAWLEVLVDVDTGGESPKVGLMGRFEGHSFATGPVSDELYSSGTKLYAPVLSPIGLGIGSYETTARSTSHAALAPAVDSCYRFGERFYTVSRTLYGMNAVGLIDPAAERFRAVLETRGDVMPTPLTSALVLREAGETSLFALPSGARLNVPAHSAFAQTPYGVLLWSPREDPDQASLLETEGWSLISAWKKPSPRG